MNKSKVTVKHTLSHLMHFLNRYCKSIKLHSKVKTVLGHNFCTKNNIPHVCIVGSGPAGFYTAHQLLKKHPNIKVDIYEKLPVPFGLVRFGVAPDHPEVKNVINTFTATAKKENCSFIGNVTIGKDVSVEDLQNAYHAVVFCYGADEDKQLGIPGEDLPNVFSARRFVGWYNGLEDDSKLPVNLDIEEVAIIGQGNVALDVGRILLMPLSELKATDICDHSLDVLSKSRIKRVHIIGRRGPFQVAFTIKEIREMINLSGCRPILQKDDFTTLKEMVDKGEDIPRPRKRLMELMVKTAFDQPSAKKAEEWKSASREWSLKFLRSPKEIIGKSLVEAVKLQINTLQGTGGSARAVETADFETLPCQMVLRSIGYRSIPIDPVIPFDKKQGIIPNDKGKVEEFPGFYCSGWVQTGPVGVILSTMMGSFGTADCIIEDINNGVLQIEKAKLGKTMISEILQQKGVQTVSFEDWEKIDLAEQQRGQKLGKPREKITSYKEMLSIAAS